LGVFLLAEFLEIIPSYFYMSEIAIQQKRKGNKIVQLTEEEEKK
jgi:hypothetical protein